MYRGTVEVNVMYYDVVYYWLYINCFHENSIFAQGQYHIPMRFIPMEWLLPIANYT